MKNKLRIIGGEWRSRQIQFAETDGLRPTPARVRETVFNWLQYDIAGKVCLDLYSGSGALGFEAASRGAATVLMVEQDAQACRQLKINVDKLQATQVRIKQQEVFRFLSGNAQAFDLVFLDPPFAKGLATQTCQWLQEKEWLNAGAKIYVETERLVDLSGMPEQWREQKSKTAGDVAYKLYEVL